jgi:hypothetical protein
MSSLVFERTLQVDRLGEIHKSVLFCVERRQTVQKCLDYKLLRSNSVLQIDSQSLGVNKTYNAAKKQLHH